MESPPRSGPPRRWPGGAGPGDRPPGTSPAAPGQDAGLPARPGRPLGSGQRPEAFHRGTARRWRGRPRPGRAVRARCPRLRTWPAGTGCRHRSCRRAARFTCAALPQRLAAADQFDDTSVRSEHLFPVQRGEAAASSRAASRRCSEATSSGSTATSGSTASNRHLLGTHLPGGRPLRMRGAQDHSLVGQRLEYLGQVLGAGPVRQQLGQRGRRPADQQFVGGLLGAGQAEGGEGAGRPPAVPVSRAAAMSRGRAAATRRGHRTAAGRRGRRTACGSP